MHTGLFGQCMLAIGDGAAAGILVNFDDAPLGIRKSIFAHVQRLGRTGEDESDADGPVLCLRRSQFFDGFDRIHLANSIDCRRYSRLLSTIVSEVERPGSGLGASLVSLQLRVCLDQLSNSQSNGDESAPVRKASSNLTVVCRLISACRSLRRLDVGACRNEQCAADGCADGSDEPAFLSDIDQALSAAARVPLEELTVRNCRDGNFGTRFSALHSLQFLSLRNIKFSFRTWSLLLEPCRRTLLTLILEKNWLDCFVYSPPFDGVELSALRTLIIETRCWVFKHHRLLSPETFRRARQGLVCVFQEANDGPTALCDCSLSPDIEVALETFCIADPSFDQLARAHELFGHRLVQLQITSGFDLLGAEQLDEIVGKLQSIRVLTMGGETSTSHLTCGGDRFLHRFLSEPGCGAKLQRLEIRWDLTAPTVRLIFEHCVNLEFLFLAPHRGSEAEEIPDITDQDLMIWAANGAKPKHVYLKLGAKFTVKGANHLLRNCVGDFHASFLDERGRFVTRNDKLISEVEKLMYVA